MTRRNPYRAALAAYPDAEIIGRLWRLAELEERRRYLATLKPNGRRVIDMWDLTMAELEITTLRAELDILGYQFPATTRPQAASTGGD